MNDSITIADRKVGHGHPCYFVAEIGSNFDGDLDRAKHLAEVARDCGAQAAKFQTFLPEKIIRAEGFVEATGFQARWSKSVWDVYQDAALPRDWHLLLRDHCAMLGIDFFSSPYDVDGLRLLDDLDVPLHKIGSGEINNLQFLREVARSGKPVMLGTGASTLSEVARAVEVIRLEGCRDIVLLQCVTNYPSKVESADLRAMVAMGRTFGLPVGYSDHTPGSLVPLGAAALGACVIEKHFTDDTSRQGPDHPFAMDPRAFAEMVGQIRLLEQAMGDGVKKVMPEEEDARVVQRRGLWIVRDCATGHRLGPDDVAVLRPAHGLAPDALDSVLGLPLARDVGAGTPLTQSVFRTPND